MVVRVPASEQEGAQAVPAARRPSLLVAARYEFAYASQRETKYDRALRRARKLRLRLGGDPADDEYPNKPPRMRWAMYNRLLDKLRAADGVADERLRRVLINAQIRVLGAKRNLRSIRSRDSLERMRQAPACAGLLTGSHACR